MILKTLIRKIISLKIIRLETSRIIIKANFELKILFLSHMKLLHYFNC